MTPTKKLMKSFEVDRTKGEPIYKQIANELRKQINDGMIGPGDKLPSIRELSQYMGVNYLTARQAIKSLSEEGILTSNLGKGTFVRPPISRAKKLALIVPNLGQPLIAEISRGVTQGLTDRDITVSIFDYHGDPRIEIETLDRLKTEEISGAIIFASMAPESNRILLRMLLDGFPAVLLDRFFEDLPTCSVESDNFSGGYMAASHLIEMGYKRIAYVGIESYSATRKRHEGYRMALAHHNMVYDAALVKNVILGSKRGETSRAATLELLDLNPRPDAIFYFNDFQALSAMRAIRQRGLEIPRDIAVVGFDDIPMASLSHPQLTTVRQNGLEIGKKAAGLLIEQLSRTTPTGRQNFLVPVELVVRESTTRVQA